MPPKHQHRATARDDLLLRDLGEYRYLKTRQIARLHFFGHVKLAQRRMRRLHSLGLVLRVPVNGGARIGFHEWLYALPPHRSDARARGQSAKESSPVLDPSRGVGPTYVAHHSCLTDFRIWLREAVDQADGRFKVHFVPGYAAAAGRRRRLAAIDVGSPHGMLIPDGVFALRRSDDRSALFFLEIDQGTEPLRGKHLSCISAKLKMYRRVYDARLFEQFSDDFGYPFEGFRALFVVPDENRASGILDVARSEDFAPLAWTTLSSSLLLGGDLSSPIWKDGIDDVSRSLDE